MKIPLRSKENITISIWTLKVYINIQHHYIFHDPKLRKFSINLIRKDDFLLLDYLSTCICILRLTRLMSHSLSRQFMTKYENACTRYGNKSKHEIRRRPQIVKLLCLWVSYSYFISTGLVWGLLVFGPSVVCMWQSIATCKF